MKRLTLFSFVLMVPLLLLGCIQGKETTQQEKEEYELKIEAKLNEIDDRILALKEEAKKAEAGLRAEIEHQVAALEQEKDELNDKLQELQRATEKDWDKLKNEIEQKLAEVEEFLDRKVQVSVKLK